MWYIWYLRFGSLFSGVEVAKPIGKQEQSVWRLECELGVIVDPECPMDGGWSPWSSWSACRGPCDDAGHRRRTRECTNPVPARDGLPCTGEEQQTEPCFLTNCSPEDYRKLIEGDAIRNQAFLQLQAVPALMERCLQMECPFEAIEAALANENIWQINPEAIWNSFHCVKHNLGCPLAGKWGSWSDWSACGARCGYGLKWRLRKCDTPPPSSANLICVGTPLQVDECQGDQCAIGKRDSGGTWAEWGKWSTCSESCGAGVRRRKRACFESNTPRVFGSWGTHCRGQYDQFEVCENSQCILDGGWSGWGAWGPCSQSCGAGKRSRSRTCTRPEPAGTGAFCIGPRTEVSSCHISPCETFTHNVAVFNGESVLEYNFKTKRSTLLHFYVRFLPLSPHGTLVRRGTIHNPLVRLSLQKWHLCLDAGGSSRSCTAPRICSQSIVEPAIWHSALITVTSEAATLRLDDQPVAVRSTFSCDPELPNERVNVFVGERLHGEIQELILNFIPLSMVVEVGRGTRSGFGPNTGSNIAYEKAGVEEGYLKLENDQYLRLPCFDDQKEWVIKLTIKPKSQSGTIIFFQDEPCNCWLHLFLQNMRVKVKFGLTDFRSESISSTECPPDLWFDITVSKKRETNTLETIINAGERLHVILDDKGTDHLKVMNKSKIKRLNKQSDFAVCIDEYFIGGVPASVKMNDVYEDFTSLTGVLASVKVNNVLLNLNEFPMERYKNDDVQVSSRTASISGSYHETAWGNSNRLNLTCLHARAIRSPKTAHWLYLDTVVSGQLKDKTVRSVDDGRVLRLVATADNDLRGFYTCRAHNNRHIKNIVTYGVLGKIETKLSGPDMTTAIAVFTTLALVLGTLSWLFVEGINDIRNGYGFFRDAHLTPEEEAEAVCKYIDQNMHLMSSKSAANVAKAKARLIGRQLASRSSVSSQGPEIRTQKNQTPSDESPSSPISEPGLPALPEVKSSSVEPSHGVFRCEQSYVSSPRHGSVSSPRTRLTSSSSFEMSSPRILCSRLLLAKRLHSSRESLSSRKNKMFRIPRTRSKLLTIKSSTFVNQSPAHKILEKFRQLKSDDT